MRLSLAMIARNEVDHIGHCLGSVKGLVDEIVVVDTGSSDGTLELCRQFGTQVVHFPWQDDFAAARNESLKRCTGDWVLVLDADEAVDVLDHPVIRGACEAAEAEAFRLILRNYLPSATQTTLDEPARLNTSPYQEGRNQPYHADCRGLRLCRRYPDLGFVGRIHELLDPWFVDRSLPIGSLDAVVHHYGKLLLDRENRKGRYYLDLALEDARREPGNHQYHFNVVHQGMMARDWPVVLAAAETYLKLQTRIPFIVLLGAGIALLQLQRPQEALRYLDWLLKESPGHTMALVQRGIALAVLGRRKEAEASLRQAIRSRPDFAMSYLNLAELEQQGGGLAKAESILKEGLAACPGEPLLLGGVVKLDLLRQDVPRAVIDAREALALCPEGGEGLWHRLVALAEQKAGRPEAALRVLDQGLEAFPGDPELARLRALLGRG